MEKDILLQSLKAYSNNRENQLAKEVEGTYNHGFVAGEVSSIKKIISMIENTFSD